MTGETKQTVRTRLRTKRDSLSGSDVREYSRLIQEKLFADRTWQKAETILAYVNIRSEVETRPIIERGAQEGKYMLVPCIADDIRSISAVHIFGTDMLTSQGPFGIPQPPAERTERYEGKIDLVLIPGIAFGRNGERIGYGKGCFDSFLKAYPEAVRAGLAFGCQVIDCIDQAQHDMPVHLIFTENGIIRTADRGPYGTKTTGRSKTTDIREG